MTPRPGAWARHIAGGVSIVLSFAVPSAAQLAAPNATGVAMGHLHYHVRDVEANARFWVALGGHRQARVSAEPAVVLSVGDVLVLLTEGNPSGGSDGSVVNHVAFRVPSLATVEAAGLTVARLERFPGVASVTSPEGERIELFEDAARNLTFTPDEGPAVGVAARHNAPLPVPVAFHHVHLYLPDGQVQAAKDWYARLFGGVKGKRSTYDAVDLPGINVNLSVGPQATAPTRGRMLAHIGFEIAGLEAFCQRLAAMGVIFDVPYEKGQVGPARAVLTDPWGTSIELTEGLRDE